MNKRKELVVSKAHELFIEKGYHATSIQDILNHSGVSKGTFYNYFASKGELFKAVFTSIHSRLAEERNALLIGEDSSNIAVFTEQIHVMMKFNKENKMLQLIEDAVVSNDPDLIVFIKQSKFHFLTWVHARFLQIFSEDKKEYLLDCAVQFTGLLQNMLQTCHVLNESITLKQIIDYSMDRILTIVEDVSSKGVQILSPNNVHKLLPNTDNTDFFDNEFSFGTIGLKKMIEKVLGASHPKTTTYLKLLFFIQDEMMHNKEPRVFLIESALLSLQMGTEFNETQEFENYQRILSKMI